MERKVHAGSVFHRRLYFGAGGGSHLCIFIRKWNSCNEGNWIYGIFDRREMEADQ